jgi:predicted nucleic acid-binding protein
MTSSAWALSAGVDEAADAMRTLTIEADASRIPIRSVFVYTQGAPFTPGDLISRLQTFATQTNHEFWPDDVSLRDGTLFMAERIHSSRQLTDPYLLALATQHAGKLATFDQAIPISAVCGAKVESLCVI